MNRSLCDASTKFGMNNASDLRLQKSPLAKQNSKMAAPKIQDVRPKMCFFLYKSKCIDFKPHKCIKVEYKVGHYGHFGAKYMLVSITVLEIQHVGTFTDSLKKRM